MVSFRPMRGLWSWLDISRRGVQIALLALALGLLAAGLALGGTERWYRVDRFVIHLGILGTAIATLAAGLRVLGLTAALAYTNFGRFHGATLVHYPELVHYQLGSKYFAELGYDDLYLAILAADRQMDHKLAHVDTVRDLESNELVPVSAVADRIARTPERFSAERWQAFRGDVAVYLSRVSARAWTVIFKDHGYNPSPIWTLVGRSVGATLSGLGVAPSRLPFTLATLDLLLLLLMFFGIQRAFGTDVLLFSAIFFGVNPLVLFDFTGGGFLRQDWLVALVLGICSVRRGWHLLGGGLLGYSVGVRLFPAAFLVLPALQFVYRGVTQRVLDRPRLLLGAGAASAFAALFVASLIFVGGLGPWKRFIANTAAHDQGVYTNHVSFRNAFIYQFGHNSPAYKALGGDYHERWRLDKEARVRRLRPVYYGAMVAVFALFAWYLRQETLLWTLCGSAFLPFLFFYPANYYYMFLLPLVFFAARDPAMLIGLFSVSAVGYLAQYVIRAYDVYHMFLSILVFGMLGVLVTMYRDEARGEGILVHLPDASA